MGKLNTQTATKIPGNVFDGGSELASEQQVGEFAWLVQEVSGAQMQLLSTEGTLGENSFYLQFEGQRTPFAHLSQTLALPPGKWQMSFRAKADRWTILAVNMANRVSKQWLGLGRISANERPV